jgi:hypothetical protein
VPPRILTFALRALARQALVDHIFGWYLDQAHPAFAGTRGLPPALVDPAATGALRMRAISHDG